LNNYATQNGWNAVHDFFKYMGFGVKIYDEAHLNFDNMFMIDCFTNTWLTYYVTATPNRSDDKENAIFKRYFEYVPSINLFDENVDPHTEYIGIKFNSNPNPIQISECKNAYGMDRNKYTNYLVHQENFYRMLRILLDKVIRKGGKYLFYIGTNEAIITVRDWIYANYPELIGQVGIFTTLTKKEDKKKQLERSIILSTTKSAGACVDIPGLVETIVLAEPFKSRVLAQQTFGRTRAENTTYKDIVDTGFFFTKRFYDQKKPIFMKYATDCKEVNITNQELIKRSDTLKEKHDRLIQPMEFFDE
jgi:superfamily II DNA or RNA helicase